MNSPPLSVAIPKVGKGNNVRARWKAATASVLSGTLTRDWPALNWPAAPKRVQDRKRYPPTGADTCAQGAWDSAVRQATTRIHLSRRHPPGDRPMHPPDNEA